MIPASWMGDNAQGRVDDLFYEDAMALVMDDFIAKASHRGFDLIYEIAEKTHPFDIVPGPESTLIAEDDALLPGEVNAITGEKEYPLLPGWASVSVVDSTLEEIEKDEIEMMMREAGID
jgi:hypothetical protein